MPLTDAKLFRLHATHAGQSKASRKRRQVTDADNLFVVLEPSGSILWRLAYLFDGKQKVLAIGRYPDVSLRQARKAADEARDLLAEGRDPSAERKAAKAKAKMAATDNAFRTVADEWFKARKVKWVDSYSERLRSRLDNDLMFGRFQIVSEEST